jgi:hypothetical protein
MVYIELELRDKKQIKIYERGGSLLAVIGSPESEWNAHRVFRYVDEVEEKETFNF